MVVLRLKFKHSLNSSREKQFWGKGNENKINFNSNEAMTMIEGINTTQRKFKIGSQMSLFLQWTVKEVKQEEEEEKEEGKVKRRVRRKNYPASEIKAGLLLFISWILKGQKKNTKNDLKLLRQI